MILKERGSGAETKYSADPRQVLQHKPALEARFQQCGHEQLGAFWVQGLQSALPLFCSAVCLYIYHS